MTSPLPKRPKVLDTDRIPMASNQCSWCAHLHDHQGAHRCCDAFPKRDSIPMTFWMNTTKHTSVVKGQTGTAVFELHPEAKAAGTGPKT